jgi:Putative Fe-S cluster
MRARGAERRETIWYRDAEVAEEVDAILFVGLQPRLNPPNYDCGACGYATCAEFLHATNNLRKGSAAPSSPAATVASATDSNHVSPFAPPLRGSVTVQPGCLLAARRRRHKIRPLNSAHRVGRGRDGRQGCLFREDLRNCLRGYACC